MNISNQLGVDEATSSNFYSWISRYMNQGRSLKDLANDPILRSMAPSSYIPILEQLAKAK